MSSLTNEDLKKKLRYVYDDNLPFDIIDNNQCKKNIWNDKEITNNINLGSEIEFDYCIKKNIYL